MPSPHTSRALGLYAPRHPALYGDIVFGLVEAVDISKKRQVLGERISEILGSTDLNDILDEAGIGAIPNNPPVKTVMVTGADGEYDQDLCFASYQRSKLSGKQVKLSTSEVGVVGTRIINGELRVDPNSRLRPYSLRGRQSSPGIESDVYLSEPVVFKAVNELAAMMTSAEYPVDYEGREYDDELVGIIKEADKYIKNIEGGFHKFLTDASTVIKHGFAPFEVVWHKGYKYPRKIAFREQATLEKWAQDEKGNALVGAEFRVYSGTTYASYTLAHGTTPQSYELMLVNAYATGNNFEGVGIRPLIGLRKLKELILQCTGIGFQKYGAPIAVVYQELVNLDPATAGIGQTGNQADVVSTVNRLANMRSQLGPVLSLEPGIKVDYVVPNGKMPDPSAMLQYIDYLMALVLSNEGAMLGANDHGSYALAATMDGKFLRSAPIYAKSVCNALTDLLRVIIDANYSKADELIEYPKYTYRFAGTQDSSAWAKDMMMLYQAGIQDWPDEARRQAAVNMGLPVSAFDAAVTESEDVDIQADNPAAVDGTADEAISSGVSVQDTALNGAQVQSLLQVVEKVTQGLIPRGTGVNVLVKAFLMTEEEANELMGDAGGSFDPKPTDEIPNG